MPSLEREREGRRERRREEGRERGREGGAGAEDKLIYRVADVTYMYVNQRKLQGFVFVHQGPNCVWHADGCDKLSQKLWAIYRQAVLMDKCKNSVYCGLGV